MTDSASAAAIAALEWVERELALSDAEIGQALGLDRKDIYRWRMREYTPTRDHLATLGKLGELKTSLERVFRKPDLAKRWFRQPLAALNNRTPVVALRDGRLDALLAHLATRSDGVEL